MSNRSELDWLQAERTGTLLNCLRALQKASPRKLRLASVAFARRLWRLFTDERSRRAVEVGESFADGVASDEKRTRAFRAARRAEEENEEHLSIWTASFCAVSYLSVSDAHRACEQTGIGAVNALAEEKKHSAVEEVRAQIAERRWQSGVLRDIFGNPYRPVAFDACWLTPTVVNLASAIYADRHLPSGLFDNQRLAVLADALEDAGCNNADILGHLRNGGDHVRGCWVVDLILGKE